ncbi:Hypothetical predicted protein [Octopus vulgaris]|uniref:Uncharacterized protein n=1 Tax=Octopus vulgaris TaxID=6645 RepID=A0AA36BUT2_OCTVU|nr:Hypothetical predicted protein [Octopus vulgaris]
MADESVKRRKTDCIKGLYADDGRKDKPEISNPMDGHMITAAEIKQAMDKMKSGKANGNDNIAFEVINALGNFGVKKFRDSEPFLQLGDVPEDNAGINLHRFA